MLFAVDVSCLIKSSWLIEVDIKHDRLIKVDEVSKLIKHDASTCIKLGASYVIVVDASSMIYHDPSSMNKVDEPSSLTMLDASSLIVYQPVINLDINNVDQGSMNNQP